jgi:amino acid adenylation domain-containing protein
MDVQAGTLLVRQNTRNTSIRRSLCVRLLVVSAATKDALSARLEQLDAHLLQGEDDLEDLAFTLARGRRAMEHRACVVLPETGELRALAESAVVRGRTEGSPASVAFMFPGQGAQFIGMARWLHRTSPRFRDTFDRCDAILEPKLGFPLKELLLVEPDGANSAIEQRLTLTSVAQPALFVVEYALAELLMSYGIRPAALIGHSVGEFAAACLSGVFELEAALDLVYERGRLMASMPPGSMLAVKCEPEAVQSLLSDTVGLAAHNTTGLSVVSGPTDAVEAFRKVVVSRNIEVSALRTSHAFHSAMMDPVLDQFRAKVERAHPKAPKIPIVSTMTGEYLTDAEATSSEYWAKQLRNPVQFAAAARRAATDPARVFLEVGPGVTLLTSVAKLTDLARRPRKLIETIGHPKTANSTADALLTTLASLWVNGADIDWEAFHGGAKRNLIRLPTYPYRRRKHWMEPPGAIAAPRAAGVESANADQKAKSPSAAPSGVVLARLKGLLEARLGRSLEEDELDSRFLELGFDSLALSQLAGKLRQEFGVRVPVRMLFEDLGAPRPLAAHIEQLVPQQAALPVVEEAAAAEAPTQASAQAPQSLEERLSRIETLLESLLRSGVHVAAPDLEARRLEEPATRTLPSKPRRPPGHAELTASQREIWVAARIGGSEANLAYNECRAFLFEGDFEERLLFEGLADLCARHDSLRQTFSRDGDSCITVPHGEIPLEKHDLRGVPPDEAGRQVQALMSAEVSEPFDLAKGPLIRGRLIDLSDTERVLVLCAHHVVVDGSSWEILIRELAELYSARRERRAPKLSNAHSFAEYAALEREYRDTGKAAAAEAFWLEHLRGQTEDLNLPADRSRPSQRSYRATRLDQQLSAEDAKRIRQTAAKAGVTAQTFLMAAFQLLLCRLSRQTDFICGVPTSGQAAAGMDSLVGHCVHVLPLRCQIDVAGSVREHIAISQRTMLDCMEHQRATFTELLPKVVRTRDPSRPALIQVAFGMGRSQKRPHFSGVNTALRVVPRVSETFELYVYATDNLGGIEVSWSYNEDLFDAGTIELWQRCFAVLLSEMTTGNLDASVSAIPLLAPADRAKLLEWSRGPSFQRSLHLPVHQAFAKQVQEAPERTAIIDEDGPHSYRSLNQRANQIAHVLRSMGLGKGNLVAVCLDRNADLVAALIGVWRAGCGYIPLDPAYPASRIEMILEDSRATLLLTSTAFRAQIPDGGRVTCLENIENEIRSQPAHAPALDCSPDDTAYVIFTSGSTGRPKGVEISQGAFENFIFSMAKQPGFTRDDCILALTTVSFDISGLELFLPLSTGGRLVMASADQARSPRHLQRLSVEHGVNVMQATPATWQMLFDSGWPGHPKLKILCGGEAFPRHLAEKFIESCGDVWNVYGPTETTVWSTLKRIVSASDISIGRPIDNTTLYVLDDDQQLVPPGAHGELWIGGDGVARGYLGRPDLTNERFIPNPFEPNQRIYRTGDLARVRADGDFECLGRVDHQVKIRGFRIELGEVETAILGHPDVKACVAVAREGRPGEMILAAYLVPNPGRQVDIDELRARLSRQLPVYMVPSAYSILAALPMTPNNKVDRKALPAPAAVRKETAKPSDEYEARMLALWTEVLELESLGTKDNFYTVGGHSLMAIRLVDRINAEFGVELPLNEFFARPTVEGASAVLRSRLNAAAPPVRPEVRTLQAAPAASSFLGGHRGLFCIQAGQPGGIPLFLLHGDKANGLLPPELDPAQEIWGYHHQGSEGERIQFRTVEALALHAHAEWLRQHGGRPCVLAGHSYGGLVAYHIAVLRDQQGLETPRTMIIDARHPAALGGRQAGYGLVGAKARAQSWMDRRRAQMTMERALEYLNRGDPVPTELRKGYILSTYMLGAHHYRPPTWSGNLDIIRSRQFSVRTPEDHWDSCGAKIRRTVVEGNHRSIVRTKEGIEPIGRWIREVFQELQSSPFVQNVDALRPAKRTVDAQGSVPANFDP